MPFDVFICYKRDSADDLAERLRDALRESNISAFVDSVDIPTEFESTEKWWQYRNQAKRSYNDIQTILEIIKDIVAITTFLRYSYIFLKYLRKNWKRAIRLSLFPFYLARYIFMVLFMAALADGYVQTPWSSVIKAVVTGRELRL